jgi:hypothetical protein
MRLHLSVRAANRAEMALQIKLHDFELERSEANLDLGESGCIRDRECIVRVCMVPFLISTVRLYLRACRPLTAAAAKLCRGWRPASI